MKHRLTGIVATAAALATALIVGPSPVPAHAVNTISMNRLAGTDRYGTAVAIVQDVYSSQEYLPNLAPVVFVASGSNYPDALSAAPAAANLGGPLLLTSPRTLPREVATEITSLEPAKIVVVGGTAAVSATVFSKLKALVPAAVVTRIAGADRFATSRAINAAAFAKSSAVFVTTGMNYPDALSAGAAAGSAGAPVVLVNGRATTLDAATRTELNSLKATSAVIVGSSGSVSSGIQAQLDSMLGRAHVARLGGADRYATSALVGAASFTSAKTAYLAPGTDFPDALAGSAMAGALHAPLLLVPQGCIPARDASYLNTLGITRVKILGGTLSPALDSLKPCAGAAAIRAGAPRTAPTFTSSTVAGRDTSPHTGPVAQSDICPVGSAVDSAGDIYVADSCNNEIEKITPDGTLSVLVGRDSAVSPNDIAVDTAGNVYFTDDAGYIRKVDTSGRLSTIAGNGAWAAVAPGPATSSPLELPHGIAVDSAGNVYAAVQGSNSVVKVTPAGFLSIVAGTGKIAAPIPGPAADSPIPSPRDVALDSFGNLYVADSFGIEKIAPEGTLSIFAGGTPGIPIPNPDPSGPAEPARALSVATDSAGAVYASVWPGNAVVTFDLSGTATVVGHDLGALTIDASSNIYVSGDDSLVKITSSGSFTIAGTGLSGDMIPGAALESRLAGVSGTAADDHGDIFLADGSHMVGKTAPDGELSIIAGTGSQGTPVPGTATASPLNGPTQLAVDAGGDIFIADGDCVEKVAPTGILTVIAGSGSPSGPFPAPSGTTYDHYTVKSIAANAGGDVFVGLADDTSEFGRILKVASNGAVTAYAGTGDNGLPLVGRATASPVMGPLGLAVDGHGNLFIADRTRYIEKVTPAGILSVIAGSGNHSYYAVGEPAFGQPIPGDPIAIAADRAGDVFIDDQASVLEIGTDGILWSVARVLARQLTTDSASDVYAASFGHVLKFAR